MPGTINIAFRLTMRHIELIFGAFPVSDDIMHTNNSHTARIHRRKKKIKHNPISSAILFYSLHLAVNRVIYAPLFHAMLTILIWTNTLACQIDKWQSKRSTANLSVFGRCLFIVGVCVTQTSYVALWLLLLLSVMPLLTTRFKRTNKNATTIWIAIQK